MKFFRTIINNLIINIKSISFWVAIAITVILCFTATLYIDSSSNKQYSVIEVLINFNKAWLLKDIAYSSQNVILAARISKLFMFIPIVASFPFIQIICDEKKSGYKRSVIIRSGKLRYHLGKIISGMISGGLVIVLGYVIFSILIMFLFPSINDYSKELINANKLDIHNFYRGIVVNLFDLFGSIGVVIPAVLGMFFYGAFAVLPTILLFSIMNNKYLLACIPFVIKYVFDMWSNKVTLTIWSGKSVNALSKWIVSNCKLENFNMIFFKSSSIACLIFYIALVISISTIYLIITYRRIDYGA